MKSSISQLPAIMLCLVLSACATVQPTDTSETKPAPASKVETIAEGWQEQELQRRNIKRWELRGRLGVQTVDNGGFMDIIWRQDVDVFSIRLLAPLGAGTTLIEGASDYAVIRYPDGSSETIDDIDRVFRQALQVELPASALKDWIRGVPASGMSLSQRKWNKMGLIERMRQDDWKVELGGYTGTDIQMPHEIYLGHSKHSEIDIRLILRQWLIDD